MPAPRRVIIDCDPGSDDALAIALAVAHADVVGITTVAGNVGLDHTTHNALRICEVLGVDVPVHAGAAGPLVGTRLDAAEIHGEDGLAGSGLPPATTVPASSDAVRFIVDSVRAEDGLWLVVIGPMTNVALALRQAPDLAGRLAGISFMGGSRGSGNATAAAEFNILADPEAAAVVLESGARLLMAGLDLTEQTAVGDDRRRELEAIDHPAARMAAGLVAEFLDRIEELGAPRLGYLHDPCAVLAVTHPELVTHDHLPVAVETTGTHTRGMTVVDERGYGDGTPNVHVGRTVDAAALWQLLTAALGG
ncbi:MAG: nucleoside hydrolase [Actinomycetota bacterium]